MAFLSQLLLLGLGTFLMIVILLQRGRGGGLAGAFGGLGGQSAFGTKAGDVFTRITIVLAVCWVIVAGSSGYFLRAGAEQRASGLGDVETLSPGDETSEGDQEFDAFGDTQPQPPTSAPGTSGDAEPGAPAGNEGDAGTTPAPEGSAPDSPDAPGGDDSAAAPDAAAPPTTPESSDQ